MNAKNAISDYIDSHREEMIEDLRTLVKIPSVAAAAEENAPYGRENLRALECALEMCRKIGMRVENVDNYMGKADFFADRENYLGILCHTDVVPEGSGWSVPPFDITRREGKLIGRGAIDDKGPAIAVLYALKAIKELNLPLEKNVRFLLGTNEENGSDDLVYYRKKEELPPLLFTPDGSYPLINIEKGMLRINLTSENVGNCDGEFKIGYIHGGKAVNAVPEYAEALILGVRDEDILYTAEKFHVDCKISREGDGFKIEVYGKGGHASTPEMGTNAVTALFGILSQLDGDNVYPEISGIAKLFPYGETDGNSCGIKCSDEISGQTTTVLSVVDFDGNKLSCKQDIRFPVCESCDGIISRLTKEVEKYGIYLEPIIKSEPHHVSEDSEFVRTLLSVYEDMTGEKGKAVAIGGGTYVHDTENGVAFGAEFPNEENNMHGADEFITEESLILNAKIYANAILKLCGKDIY